MKLKTEPKVLNNVLAINLDVNIWSARRKLNPEDFKHAQLPPEQLASLGSKKICNPADLKIFGTLKSRAVSLLDKIGVRFLGGWAIPEEKAGEVTQGLQVISDEYYSAKSAFITNYDTAVQDWIKSNPGWEKVISSSTVDASYVSNRIAFNWQAFKVASPGKQTSIQCGLNSEVENLGSTLFDEIAKVARDAWEKTFRGRKEITRKALSPLKTIMNKLDGLHFIEPRVLPIAELINKMILSLPQRGSINGNALLMLQGLVTMLSDPTSMCSYAQEMIDGRSHEEILLSLSPSVKQPNKDVPPAEPKVTTPEPIPQLESHGLW